jgi:hypothetical protein
MLTKMLGPSKPGPDSLPYSRHSVLEKTRLEVLVSGDSPNRNEGDVPLFRTFFGLSRFKKYIRAFMYRPRPITLQYMGYTPLKRRHRLQVLQNEDSGQSRIQLNLHSVSAYA